VARAVGARIELAENHAAGIVYGYFPGVAPDGYNWYWRPGVCVGVIPTNNGDACIFVAVHAERFRAEIRSDIVAGFSRVLAECAPEVAATVAAMPRAGTLKAFAGAPGFLRRSWGAGWALVGDAGYFKDPITAHGITDALRDAELLARALVRGSPEALAEYQASRDGLAREFLAMTVRIASFEWTLEELAAIHVALNKEMKRDEAALLALGSVPARAATERAAPQQARGG
jgi:flavin-dependent dehydrogenase